jgi:hypothetical protein
LKADYRVPPAGFKYLVTEMVCWATGGPQKYKGKSMALKAIVNSTRSDIVADSALGAGANS